MPRFFSHTSSQKMAPWLKYDSSTMGVADVVPKRNGKENKNKNMLKTPRKGCEGGSP